MTGLSIKPKSSEKKAPFVLHVFRFVPRPENIFHPVVAALIFSKPVFGIRKILSSQVEEPQKKKRYASIVRHPSSEYIAIIPNLDVSEYRKLGFASPGLGSWLQLECERIFL